MEEKKPRGVIIIICAGCAGVSVANTDELLAALGTLARLSGAKTYEWHSVDAVGQDVARLSGNIADAVKPFRKA